MGQPNFSFERRLWRQGCSLVAGVDEVGRGAWAGPLVTAAVVFPSKMIRRVRQHLDGLNDSKLLKPKFREQLVPLIKAKAVAWDVTEVGVSVINRIGIGKATAKAMRKTIKDLGIKLGSRKLDFVLIDYFAVSYLRGLGIKKQRGIKKGDRQSFSIAAASVLAKVHRDQIMRRLARRPRYKPFGWDANKGYGTKAHQKAILQHGLTRLHRQQFVQTWQEKQGAAIGLKQAKTIGLIRKR